MHNLYGAYEVKATAEALRAIRNKRQFIFTRCGRRLGQGPWLTRRCAPNRTLNYCIGLNCMEPCQRNGMMQVAAVAMTVSASQRSAPQASGPALYSSYAWVSTTVLAVTWSMSEGMQRQIMLNSLQTECPMLLWHTLCSAVMTKHVSKAKFNAACQ